MRKHSPSTRPFDVLGHPDRVAILEVVTAAGPEGVSAGEIARGAGLAAQLTTYHLNLLSDAGLVVARRAGRRMIYRVRKETVRAMLDAIVSGVGEIRRPVLAGGGISIGSAAHYRQLIRWPDLPPLRADGAGVSAWS